MIIENTYLIISRRVMARAQSVTCNFHSVGAQVLIISNSGITDDETYSKAALRPDQAALLHTAD